MSFLKKIQIALCLLLGFGINAQTLNNYQYVVVPEQFEFQKRPHQYDVNKLTQFLFNKYKFRALIKGDPFPDGVTICDVLQVTAKGGGFIKTTVALSLADCNGKLVYTSPEGVSRNKDYKKAYHEAIRNVFNDPQLKKHVYFPLKKPKVGTTEKNLPALITQPRPVKPIQEVPKVLTGKRVTKTPAKATGPSLLFELRGKEYTFKPQGKNYVIIEAGNPIGLAKFNTEKTNYTLKAGALSGTGIFDDYGNFELSRVNPVTQKPIKDVLARVE